MALIGRHSVRFELRGRLPVGPLLQGLAVTVNDHAPCQISRPRPDGSRMKRQNSVGSHGWLMCDSVLNLVHLGHIGLWKFCFSCMFQG